MRIFSIVGMLVLIIACINFVNLSTARAEKRAREVGLRKSIGSTRKQLVIQFLSESMLITFMGFAVSLGMVDLALPYFNTATCGNMSLPYSSIVFWCVILGYVVVTGLLAGSRPAFYLSSFNPVNVLKGTVQLGKRAALPTSIRVIGVVKNAVIGSPFNAPSAAMYPYTPGWAGVLCTGLSQM